MRLARALLFAIGFLLASSALSAFAATDVTGPEPLILNQGWEAADGDPADGVAGLSALRFSPVDPLTGPGPRGTVRWYRTRLDLSRFRGEPVGFAVLGLRDVDETFLEGVRIGGLGSFPPNVESAHLLSRLYPLPASLTAQPGEKTLVIRVWHGQRAGTIFRFAPRIERLSVLYAWRSRIDQGVTFFAGIAIAIAIVLALFALHARRLEFPLFAAFALCLALYAATLHSGFATSGLPRSTAFRLGVFAGAGLLAVYLPALCMLVRIDPPRRYWAFGAFSLGIGLLAVVAPDPELLVIPLRGQLAIFLYSLFDIFVFALLWAAVRGRRRAVLASVGHVVFAAGAIILADVGPVFGGVSVANPRWGILLLVTGFFILAMTFLVAMSDQMGRFRVAALTDPATRLWNRAALFEEIAEKADARRRGRGESFGLVLLDLDRFKEWNDRHGHLAGDKLLVHVARALQDASRPGDLVSRYGGDEFAVIIEDVGIETARVVAERFHKSVNTAIANETSDTVVSASAGVSVFRPERHGSASALFQDADRALYKAKGEGRNRVAEYSGELAPSAATPGRDSNPFLSKLAKGSGFFSKEG